MSDSNFLDPEFVAGAIHAQIEDLSHDLQIAVVATVLADLDRRPRVPGQSTESSGCKHPTIKETCADCGKVLVRRYRQV